MQLIEFILSKLTRLLKILFNTFYRKCIQIKYLKISFSQRTYTIFKFVKNQLP